MSIDYKKIRITKTNSCSYFLPLLHRVIGFKYIPQIASSYIWDNEEDRHFCVLYEFSGKRPFLKYEGELMDHELYIGHEDHDKYTLYKFQIPQNLKWVLTMMMERKINMLDEESKTAIINFNIERLANVEVIRDVLDGRFPIMKTYMKDETFVNFVDESQILDANDLYKRIKDE